MAVEPGADEATHKGQGARRDLTTGPISSTLLIFALPVLGSNVLQSINGAVNSIWTGRLLGEGALAATSNANLVMMLLLGAVFGVGMAATIMIGQAMGAHDLRQARKVVGTGATFFLFVSILFAVAGWFLADEILTLLGTPADAMPLAEAYLRVIFLAMPALNFLSFMMSVLRGSGDSRTPFLFMVASVVLDVILNPLLISGYGPFPQMGIAGSATATLISNTIPLIGLIALLYWRKDPLRLAGADLALLRPDPALIRIIVQKGVPIGLQMVVMSASALTIMGLVNQGGSQVTAAYGIAAQLWTYVQMPALAIGAAVSSMAAQNIGAGRWDRVSQITRSGVIFNLILTSATVGVLYLFERQVLGWFLGLDSPAVGIAAHINNFVGWSFILFGITIVLFSTVRATGAVTPPLIILIISTLIVRTSFAYLMRGQLGNDALWISFPVGNITAVVLAVLYYRYGRWRGTRIEVGEPSREPAPETIRVDGDVADTGYAVPCHGAAVAEKAGVDRKSRYREKALT